MQGISNGGCLPLKKRIFDPLLLQRLVEFDMGLNTPWVPEGTVADILYILYMWCVVYTYIYIYI